MLHMAQNLDNHTRCIITLTLTLFLKLWWKPILWCATLLSEHVMWLFEGIGPTFSFFPNTTQGFFTSLRVQRCLWRNQIPCCCWTELITGKVFLTFTRNRSSLLIYPFFSLVLHSVSLPIFPFISFSPLFPLPNVFVVFFFSFWLVHPEKTG